YVSHEKRKYFVKKLEEYLNKNEKKWVEVWLRGGSDEDCQAVDPAWGAHDHDRHGTLMAGTALYGA
ncbi:hypothetical protein, partial [Vibrio sp.]|uniref:hypothetical protein n=1 Tax=Vibrio sp. TaxID=678 RepID=UPI003D146199